MATEKRNKKIRKLLDMIPKITRGINEKDHTGTCETIFHYTAVRTVFSHQSPWEICYHLAKLGVIIGNGTPDWMQFLLPTCDKKGKVRYFDTYASPKRLPINFWRNAKRLFIYIEKYIEAIDDDGVYTIRDINWTYPRFKAHLNLVRQLVGYVIREKHRENNLSPGHVFPEPTVRHPNRREALRP